MVVEFGVEGNQWVREMTSLRCEGLNSQIGRYVHVKNNLTEFLKQFNRYMSYTRQRELEANFESIVGDPVGLTPLEEIERFAAKIPELPECVVLTRWTKYAKQCVEETTVDGARMSDAIWRNRMVGLLFDCYEMIKVAERSEDRNDSDDDNVAVGDVVRVRTKGCGSRQASTSTRGDRRVNCCSVCQRPSHNKKTCPSRLHRCEASTSGKHMDNENTNNPMMGV
ncbi:protein FAR1-RELATED SEQUENCE 5-like [Sesbania bispinosa]|nr:protein FAR1-RELATED SEQUENCE 5-like [Sesbania bispinosa]